MDLPAHWQHLQKIELIDGRTPGTRDHAPDGFTGHCWVRIDNRYYDPEADWAGWMTGVYGYNSYPIRHYVKKIYNFMRQRGRRAKPRKIS